MEAAIYRNEKDSSTGIEELLTSLLGVFRRVFGCWHRQLSLPFSRGNESYRTCVACGARRDFDPDRWEMVGPFYYPGRSVRTRTRRRKVLL